MPHPPRVGRICTGRLLLITAAFVHKCRFSRQEKRKSGGIAQQAVLQQDFFGYFVTKLLKIKLNIDI